jgi:pimeloyl-ACP methyl ester carboxylesterase
VGTGPHLCFLHGFCENSEIWQNIVNDLAPKYTCISIDLPGFGKSSNLKFASIAQISLQVHQLLLYENATQTIILGHSMGGYIVADYLGQYGASLRGAAFIHSTALADSEEKKVNRQKSINFIEKSGTAEFFRLFIPGLVAVHHLAKCREQMTKMVTATKISSVLAGLNAMKNRENKLAEISRFDKPILWLQGDLDTHYQKDEIYKQAALCRLCQVTVVEGVGHLSMLEDYKKSLHSVQTFLKFVETVSSTS